MSKPLSSKPLSSKPCPNCGKPPEAATKPFCSVRCQQLDLGRWLTGAYAVAAVEEDDFDSSAESDEG